MMLVRTFGAFGQHRQQPLLHRHPVGQVPVTLGLVVDRHPHLAGHGRQLGGKSLGLRVGLAGGGVGPRHREACRTATGCDRPSRRRWPYGSTSRCCRSSSTCGADPAVDLPRTRATRGRRCSPRPRRRTARGCRCPEGSACLWGCSWACSSDSTSPSTSESSSATSRLGPPTVLVAVTVAVGPHTVFVTVAVAVTVLVDVMTRVDGSRLGALGVAGRERGADHHEHDGDHGDHRAERGQTRLGVHLVGGTLRPMFATPILAAPKLTTTWVADHAEMSLHTSARALVDPPFGR